MVDTSCMSLDHITTSTCFPEPATSSGHLGLLHLGDESALCTLTRVFSHHCQHFPSSLPHHQPVGLFLVLLKFSSRFRSSVGFSCLFSSLRLCVSASTPCVRVLCPHHRTPSPSNSSPSPESLRIVSPRVFKRPQLFLSPRHAVIYQKANRGEKATTATATERPATTSISSHYQYSLAKYSIHLGTTYQLKYTRRHFRLQLLH